MGRCQHDPPAISIDEQQLFKKQRVVHTAQHTAVTAQAAVAGGATYLNCKVPVEPHNNQQVQQQISIDLSAAGDSQAHAGVSRPAAMPAAAAATKAVVAAASRLKAVQHPAGGKSTQHAVQDLLGPCAVKQLSAVAGIGTSRVAAATPAALTSKAVSHPASSAGAAGGMVPQHVRHPEAATASHSSPRTPASVGRPRSSTAFLDGSAAAQLQRQQHQEQQLFQDNAGAAAAHRGPLSPRLMGGGPSTSHQRLRMGHAGGHQGGRLVTQQPSPANPKSASKDAMAVFDSEAND